MLFSSASRTTPTSHTAAKVALALLLLTACSNSHRGEVSAAPNFELQDLSGNVVRLESFRGHPVFLDFWATWCGPCRMSIPMVQDFYARHKAEGLVVIGMNMDDDPSGVYGFVKKFKMTYPVVFAAESTAPGDYEVEGIPHFVFIDKKGQVFDRYQGFSPQMIDLWEDDLQKALKSAK
jgi:thiol-disulfide isomerase/thioredoxin